MEGDALELHASRRYTFNAGRRILRMSIGDDAVIGFAIRSLQSLVAIRSQIRPEYDSPQLSPAFVASNPAFGQRKPLNGIPNEVTPVRVFGGVAGSALCP